MFYLQQQRPLRRVQRGDPRLRFDEEVSTLLDLLSNISVFSLFEEDRRHKLNNFSNAR